MLGDKVVARRVVEHGEAPWVTEDDEMRLARVKVTEERLGAGSKLAHGGKVVNAPSQARLEQVSPDEIGPAIPSDLKVGEEAVDNVGIGGQDVDGIHLGVRFAPFLDALDCCVPNGGG